MPINYLKIAFFEVCLFLHQYLCLQTKFRVICHPYTAIRKNSPVKGWSGLSKNVQKISKMSRIELSQLGQYLFHF